MDEIILVANTPTQVVPTTTTTLYNPMLGDDDLMVSSHGDIDKKWLKVEQGDYVKFATPIWLLQTSNGQVILPAFETI